MDHVEDLWGHAHGNVAGYYLDETIYVETEGTRPLWEVLYHELGHHADYMCGDGTGGEQAADRFKDRMLGKPVMSVR